MLSDAAREQWTIISDTSWAGYEDIPRLIMLGYTRLLDEVESQSSSPTDVIFVQAGVGGLLAATACWANWRYGNQRPSTFSSVCSGLCQGKRPNSRRRPV